MATYTKVAISGASNGKAVQVAATATPGTLVHTAQSGTSNFDNIKLYAYNGHTADVVLTIEYGGTTSTDQIIVTIPFQSGLILIIPSLILQNSLVLRAFASVASVVNLFGFVNRIS